MNSCCCSRKSPSSVVFRVGLSRGADGGCRTQARRTTALATHRCQRLGHAPLLQCLALPEPVKSMTRRPGFAWCTCGTDILSSSLRSIRSPSTGAPASSPFRACSSVSATTWKTVAEGQHAPLLSGTTQPSTLFLQRKKQGRELKYREHGAPDQQKQGGMARLACLMHSLLPPALSCLALLPEGTLLISASGR